MKRVKIFCCVGLLVISLGFNGQAADKPSAAMRAYLYQREARAVLTQHDWRITQDHTGKLIANRPTQTNPVLPFFEVALLTLTFKPDSDSHTQCAANVVAYTYERGVSPARQAAGPLPYNTPEVTKEIQDMMVQCEKQLIVAHPEYAKH